jgi:thiol-disulfide isomerase/thioredoxin
MAKKAKKNFKQEQLELEEEKVVEEEVSEEETEEIDEDEIEESEEELEEETEDEDSDDESDEDEDSEEDEDDDDDNEDDEDEEEETRVIVKNPVRKTMSDKARYIIVAISCIALIALIACMAIFGSKDKEKDKTSNSNSTPTENIKKEDRNTSTDFLKEFYEQMDSKDKNVIFFASATCGYCSLEKPIIENISKDYDMSYYAIDASTLNQTELNEVVRALGIRGATPTTAIVQDGKVLTYNEGYLDGKPFVEFFKKNGMLPEDAKYKQEAKIKDISYSEFKDKAKKDKNTLFLIDQSACSQCNKAREVLNKLADKNKIDVYHLNAANLSEDEIKKIVEEDLKKMEFNDDNYKKNKEVNIPLLLVVKNNKIKAYVIESSSEEDFTKVLKKYDFIK